MRKRNT